MLLRFDPFRELDRVSEAAWGPRPSPSIPMDAVRKGDHVIVRFDLPGVDPSSIDLEVERNVLTLHAERAWAPAEGEEVLANERRQGSFRRQLLLGDTLDGDRIQADYRDGVLTLTVPVAETAKPRKVEVSHDTPTIEASSSAA
ncbi:MAG TPA: Hsp20/alpha crystallin family protein [Acidimicrobiales bacterium]|nr:Hsp20/alpha crystallin family protein [Acidimicrobiales bacterium]